MVTEKGKVIFVGEVRRGIGSRTGKEWVAQTFVIETEERNPRRIAWDLFGEDKISRAEIKVGEFIELRGYPESHEYNGNWYTQLICLDISAKGISRFAALEFGKWGTFPSYPEA